MTSFVQALGGVDLMQGVFLYLEICFVKFPGC